MKAQMKSRQNHKPQKRFEDFNFKRTCYKVRGRLLVLSRKLIFYIICITGNRLPRRPAAALMTTLMKKKIVLKRRMSQKLLRKKYLILIVYLTVRL